MICPHCGAAVKDGARFCSSCGAPLSPDAAAQPAHAPAETLPSAPVACAPAPPAAAPGAAPKKSRKRLFILAAVLVLVLALGAAASALLFTPKNRLVMAAAKSAKAYSSAAQELIALDYAALVKEQAFSQTLSVSVSQLPTAQLPCRLGAQLRIDADMPGEFFGIDAALLSGDETLLSLRLGADGDTLFAASPTLFDDVFYGVNTRTLGEDIAASPLNLDPDGQLSNLSFNVFELYADYLKPDSVDPAALKDFSRAIEVAKKGKQSLRVNGNSLSCTEYLVRIPTDALADLLEAWYGPGYAVSDADNLRDMMEAAGIPAEDMPAEDLAGGYGSPAAYGSTSSSLDFALETLRAERKPIKLTVYVSGGYVVGVDWSGKGDFSELSVQLRLGGGRHYADDLSLTVTNYDEEVFFLASSGSHVLADGVYTDETVFRSDSIDGSFLTRYAPSESGSNYSLRAEAGDDYDRVCLDLSGRIESDKQTLRIALDDVALYTRSGGSESDALRGAIEYAIMPFAQSYTVEAPVSVLSMSGEALLDLAWSAVEALDQIETDHPELDLFEDLFY